MGRDHQPELETMSNRTTALPLTFALAALLSAAPLLAQGNSQGKGKGQDRGNPNRVELREDQPDQDRRLQRRDQDRRGNAQQGARRVPPGWCIGRGNPHNTPENCGYNRDTRRDSRWPVYDSRRDSRSSYDQRHAEFHRRHDAICRERARAAGGNVREVLRVRTECRRIHEEWHRRAGIAHR
jgi:hypothetical protein